MCDDSERNREQLMLIGQAFVSTLNQLEKQELWDAVPNIPLICSMFIEFASSDFKSLMQKWTGEEYVWPYVIRAYSIKHGFEIEGVYEIEQRVCDYDVQMLPDGETIAMICLALLTMLNQLEKDKLWDEVPNLSLILGIYFSLLNDFEDAIDCAENEDCASYPAMIRLYAEKHNMEIKGVHDAKQYVEKFDTEELEEAQVKLVKKAAVKDKFKFKQAVGFRFSPRGYGAKTKLSGTTSSGRESAEDQS